jgi:Alcohol dehydrogenase GroES-like domain
MVNFGYFVLVFRKSARGPVPNSALRMAAKRCRQQGAAFNLAVARNHLWQLSVDLAELESQRITQRAKDEAVEVREPKGPFVLVEREVPSPRTGQVLIKVEACGICHSDVFTKEGLWPGLASDGTEDIAAAANGAAVVISSAVSAFWCRESVTMAVMPILRLLNRFPVYGVRGHCLAN